MLSNLWLLAQLFWKVGNWTMVIPSLFIYAVVVLVRALGWVPAHKQLETWTEPEKAELRRAA